MKKSKVMDKITRHEGEGISNESAEITVRKVKELPAE